MKKRIGSLLLLVAMMLSLVIFPSAVSADEIDLTENWLMYAAKYSSTDYTVIPVYDPNTGLPIGLRDTGFEMNSLDDGSIYVTSPDYDTNRGVHPTAAVTSKEKTALDNLEVLFNIEQERFFQNNGFGSSFSFCWTTQPVTTLPASLYYISQNGMRGYPVDAEGATGDDLNYGLYVVFVSPREYSNTSVAYDVYVIFDNGTYNNTHTDGWHGYRWTYEGLNINVNDDIAIKVSPDATNGYVVNVNGTNLTNANDAPDDHENITMNFGILKDKTGYVSLCSSGGFQKTDTCNFTWKEINGYGPAYGFHDHQMSAEKVVKKEAGCVDGYKAYVCSVCGYETDVEVINALYDGHDYVKKTILPTYVTGGYDVNTCSRCGDSYQDNYTQAKSWDNPFDDVASTDWFYNAVAWANDQDPKIVGGTSATTFSPNILSDRAMVVTLLGRINGITETPYPTEASFPDVVTNTWYSSYVKWASDNDYVNGYDDGTFLPMKKITRQELAQLFYNYVKTAYNVTVTDTSAFDAFADKDTVAIWAKDAVTWALSIGLIGGMDGNINPGGLVPRAQLVQLFYNYINVVQAKLVPISE